jgi:predicted ATPase
MELQLKNIGMIKEANVKLDGLTVIAGENDTGKSTVGKALYLVLKSIPYKEKEKNILGAFGHVGISLLFNANEFPDNATLKLKKNDKEYIYDCQHQFFNITDDIEANLKKNDLDIDEVIFIETPLIWNLFSFFSQIPKLESAMKVFVEYPYLLQDLYLKLSFKTNKKGIDISQKVISLMHGNFEKDEKDNMFFLKNDKRIELINIATGIKMFGIFQVLSQNNYLNENTVLVLDEPEVHLHPKWQLEMANIIVELVKNGVKILVNSHSPYMIEALERYAEKAEVSADFYLAEDGVIAKVEDNNSKTLAKIFHKLSAPYETFNQMDSEILKGG